MKLLISDKEIAQFLYEFIGLNLEELKSIKLKNDHIASAIDYVCREKNKKSFNLDKKRDKLKAKIRRSVEKDLRNWTKTITAEIESQREKRLRYTQKYLNYFIEKLGQENILKLYSTYKKNNFVKSTGFGLEKNSILIRRKDYSDYSESCLFRNMEGNEKLLLYKMRNNFPFWFIDTGYTNFLSGKGKKWHRLTKNHMHHTADFLPPVDRLEAFETFPKPWRDSGEKILIIEPGEFCARTFGININQWKKDIVEELRKYTDKKIVIREKLSKKVRKSLYRELCDEDYYCVININSNAATEAIWAGIPAITLDTHITNSITRNKISDINNLYRPHLSNWLCMLSYSQFTYDELVDGTAAMIAKKYYA